MNVLISSGFPYWNAEAEYAAILAELLREAGHGVWMLVHPGTRNAQELHRRGLAPLTGLLPDGASPWRWRSAIRRLTEFQQRQRIDVVNVFRSAEFPLHLFAARWWGGPKVVRTRGGAQAERRGWLNRRLYGRGCQGVIACADVIRHRLESRLMVPPERIRTIYYPAAPTPMPTEVVGQSARQSLLAELSLPEEALLLGVVGRIAPEKGHGTLLEALRMLPPSLPKPHLLILNKAYASEAPHRAHLERRIAEMQLGDRVTWLGYRKDVGQIMSGVDMGVIPSVASEMICRVAVEFLAAGTPVVALPTGALPEVIGHGVSGLIAASPDAAALAEELATLASHPGLRRRMGAEGRNQVRRRFSREGFLAAHLEVFERALAVD